MPRLGARRHRVTPWPFANSPGFMALAPYDRKYRCRTDLVMQRSAEDLPPFKLLKKIARGGAEA